MEGGEEYQQLGATRSRGSEIDFKFVKGASFVLGSPIALTILYGESTEEKICIYLK